MRKILLSFALVLPLLAGATDIGDGGFAGINVKFKGRGPNIKDFVSARLIDNGDFSIVEQEGDECLNDIAATWRLYLQGKPLDEGRTFIVDTANGFMRYDAQSSYGDRKQMEMCYWNCSDGKHKLVADNIECYDEYGRQIQTECTGYTFFMYDNYFHRMAPIACDEVGFDLDELLEPGTPFSMALPRQGKTVVITCETPSGKQTHRLTWNGSKFIKGINQLADDAGITPVDFNLLAVLNADSLAQFGLSLIYEEKDEPDNGDAGMYEAVYGRGVERGEKLDFGYELKAISDHACYISYQMDTSQQTTLCFKSKDDADDFFAKALAYGLVECDGSYYIPEEKLPNGTVHADSLGDYNILAQIEKPELGSEFHQGFYVIRINYFA